MARRRGPYASTAVLAAAILLDGEEAYDVGLGRKRVGDGSTAGGRIQATKSEVDAVSAVANAAATQSTVTALTATVAGKASTASLGTAVDRIDALEDAQTSGLIAYGTWAALAAHPTGSLTVGQVAKVYGPDAGTHTDPVAGGTVANKGVFNWSASPAGWRRIANLEVEDVSAEADRAEAAVADIDVLFPIVSLSVVDTHDTLKLTPSAGSVSPTCYQAHSFTNGTAYVLDILCRAGEHRVLNVFSNGGALFDATVDLKTRQTRLGTGNVVTITPKGNNWLLVSIAVTATSTASANVQLRVRDNTGAAPFTANGTDTLYIEDVILHVAGSTTSLLTSRLLSDASWTKASCAVAAATVTSLTAGAKVEAADTSLNGRLGSKFVEGSGSVGPTCYRAGTFTNGLSYTASAIVAAGERSVFNIFCNGGALFDANFDLQTGTATGTGATITPRGNGEYLCEVTLTSVATTTGNVQFRMKGPAASSPYTGNGTSGLFVLEVGCRQGSGENQFWPADDFSNAAWIKSGMTVTPNARAFASLDARVAASEATLRSLTGAGAWAGKKIDFLGTSITEQSYFYTPLAARLGANAVNRGVSGASLGVNGSGLSLGVYNSIASVRTDADCVSFDGLINDFGLSTPLGALGDTTTATFYGALYAAIVAVRARAPGAAIRLSTPYSGGAASTYRIGVTNSAGHTLSQYIKAIRDVADYMGVWLSEVGTRAGIGYTTASIFLSDDLHLNTTGGNRYSSFEAENFADMARHGILSV